MLMPRIITGMVLLAAIFFSLFFTSASVFFWIVTGLLVWSSWEWSRLIGLTLLAKRCFLVTFYLLIAMGMFWLPIGMLLIVCSLWWFAVLWILLLYRSDRFVWTKSVRCGVFMGIPTLGSSFIGFNVLRNFEQGVPLIFYFVLLIAAADSGAYFIGRMLGKKKLSPALSPNKTWAGLYGGLISSALMAVAGSLYFKLDLPAMIIFVLLSLLAALFSVAGDLFMSLLKRQQQLKDTGRLLPGHGGLLDRLDGFNGAISIFTLGLILLIKV